MRSFLAVVAEGSQVGAAKVLGIDQSTVARHIDRAQQHFGGGLFIAGGSGPLSTRGAIVEQSFSATLAELTRARDRLAERPVLRIGFIRPMRAVVAQTLRACAGSGDFDVALIELTSARQARALVRRELDIAICYALPELAERSSIEESVVTEEPLALVLPQRAWVREEPALDVLRELTYARSLRGSSALVEATDTWLSERGLEPKRVADCTTGSEVLAYAASGYGYGFLPALWRAGGHPGAVFAPIASRATAKIAAYTLAHVTPMMTRLRGDLSNAARAALEDFRIE